PTAREARRPDRPTARSASSIRSGASPHVLPQALVDPADRDTGPRGDARTNPQPDRRGSPGTRDGPWPGPLAPHPPARPPRCTRAALRGPVLGPHHGRLNPRTLP